RRVSVGRDETDAEGPTVDRVHRGRARRVEPDDVPADRHPVAARIHVETVSADHVPLARVGPADGVTDGGAVVLNSKVSNPDVVRCGRRPGRVEPDVTA